MIYNYLKEGYFSEPRKHSEISVEDTKSKIQTYQNNIIKDNIQDLKDMFYGSADISVKTLNGIHTLYGANTPDYNGYISEYVGDFLSGSLPWIWLDETQPISLIENNNFKHPVFSVKVSDLRTIKILKYIISYNYNDIHQEPQYKDDPNFSLFYSKLINVNTSIQNNALHITLDYDFRFSDHYYNSYSADEIEYIENPENAQNIHPKISAKFDPAAESLVNLIKSGKVSYDKWRAFFNDGKYVSEIYKSVFATPKFISELKSDLNTLAKLLSYQPIFEDKNGCSIPVVTVVKIYNTFAGHYSVPHDNDTRSLELEISSDVIS